jgi:hypothetical protein
MLKEYGQKKSMRLATDAMYSARHGGRSEAYEAWKEIVRDLRGMKRRRSKRWKVEHAEALYVPNRQKLMKRCA